MKQFSYTISDELGIHARPAGQLVKCASAYKSTVTAVCGGKKADAKKIMSLMMLAAKRGQEVTVTVEGEDEEEAAVALLAFMKEHL